MTLKSKRSVARAGVAAEVELGDVEAVHHVERTQVDPDGLTGRAPPCVGVVGGLADDLDARCW